MAEPLVITIPHKLGKEGYAESSRRSEKPRRTFQSSRWRRKSGQTSAWIFVFRALGQVAAGNVQVAEDSVRLEVTLPWLLHKFAEAVQKTISGQGRVLLEKK